MAPVPHARSLPGPGPVLLYRAWEDVAFVDSTSTTAVRRRPTTGSRRSPAGPDRGVRSGPSATAGFSPADNNYDWYRPRDEALVDVLYALTPFPLGKLDADVLGGLYESYVEEIDRDRLGQFFTPRSWCASCSTAPGSPARRACSRSQGDERKPRRVLDFATGSGGFLSRLRGASSTTQASTWTTREGLRRRWRDRHGFYGGEISPFPYYLTEINLLLQVSRLLGRLRLPATPPPTFVLGVLHADTL